MAKGDHLMISMGAYQHHAIDRGDGTVIQYGGADMASNSVEVVSLDVWPQDVAIHVLDVPAQFEPDEILSRAESRLGEQAYCLATNNCEHFVNWSRTGEKRSRQVDRVVERTASLAAKLMAKRRTRSAARNGIRWLSRGLVRSVSPWLLAADVAQLGVEVAASSRGVTPHHAERVGQAVGLGASVGIGALTGGPVGIVAGIGIWAVGEAAGKFAANR